MAEDNVPASPSGGDILVPEKELGREPADTAVGDSTSEVVKEGAVESDEMSDGMLCRTGDRRLITLSLALTIHLNSSSTTERHN